jgi:anti-sigma factor RsiW
MTSLNHPWLERVAAYHSGGIDEYEQHAVEQHLATCAICQNALFAYQRFYSLAASPLRFG